MATWGAIPTGQQFLEVGSDYEAPANTYLRLKQTRQHLKTNFDPSIAEIVRTLYDGAKQSGDMPVYIEVVDVGTDPMWRKLDIDIVVFHKTGTMLHLAWAAIIIVGAIVTYFLIHSIYYIATGEVIPPPGYKVVPVTNPVTGETYKDIVPIDPIANITGNLGLLLGLGIIGLIVVPPLLRSARRKK